MSDKRDTQGKSEPRWPIDSTPPSTPDRGAGRIVHDERGNAVWNWVKETGRFCIDSTSALLKTLEIADLEIADKDKEAKPGDPAGRDAGGGYDPYNQKMPVKKATPPKKP